MANTTPAVNLDPNFTKNSTYSKIVQRAFDGRLAEGDPLAASYDMATWGGRDPTHHIIAANLFTDDPSLSRLLKTTGSRP